MASEVPRRPRASVFPSPLATRLSPGISWNLLECRSLCEIAVSCARLCISNVAVQCPRPYGGTLALRCKGHRVGPSCSPALPPSPCGWWRQPDPVQRPVANVGLRLASLWRAELSPPFLRAFTTSLYPWRPGVSRRRFQADAGPSHLLSFPSGGRGPSSAPGFFRHYLLDDVSVFWIISLSVGECGAIPKPLRLFSDLSQLLTFWVYTLGVRLTSPTGLCAEFFSCWQSSFC